MSAFRLVLVFFVIALLGVGLASRLSLTFTPQPLTSSFVVSYSLSEATPMVVEQQATALLENALSQINGIKRLYSQSGYASGTVELEFDSQEDLAFKKVEIITTLRKLKGELPDGMGFPTVYEGNHESEEEEPLLIYAISSTQGLAQVQEIINHSIIPKISSIEGIRNLVLSGTRESAIAIAYDSDKLKASDISLTVLTQVIQNHATVSFENSVEHQQHQLPLVAGNPLTFNALKNIPVTDELTLSDLCTISLTEKQPDYIHRINGQEAILLSIYAHKGVNRISAADQVEMLLREINTQQNLPLSIIKRYDDTTFLREEIHKAYYRSAFSILILSVFILLFTLRWRQLIILFSGLMINVGTVLLFAYLLGLEIHLYTLAGLTVSFGLLVDNALVMLDHYTKYRNKAILPGLIAASLTTVAALGIIFFLPREDRQNLTDFAWIVMLSLGCSLVIAWLFTPAMSTLIAGNTAHSSRSQTISRSKKQVRIFKRYHHFINWLAERRRWVIALMIWAFGLPVYLLPGKWEGHEWYNTSIGSDYYQEELRPYVDQILGGSSRLFYRRVFERGGFRNPDKTRLYIRAELPFGHTLKQMDHTIRQVEDYLQTVEGISVFLTYIYSGSNAQVIIEFDEDQEQGSLPYLLKNRLTTRALDWGGVEWDIYGVGRGFSNATGDALPSFRVKMQGHQFEKLAALSDVFAEKLLSHQRIQTVNTNDHLSWGSKDLEEFVLEFDRQYYRHPASSIVEALSQAGKESYPISPSLYINLNNKNLPVYVEALRNEDFSPYRLMHHHFGDVPLNQVADLTHRVGSPEIHKENRQYLRMVSFDYFGSPQFGQKYLDRVIDEMQEILPPGFEIQQSSYSWFGEKEKRQYELIPLLILIIYLICVIFFENFRQPLWIIFIIPASFVGLFLIFAWGEFSFDQGGYAAFLMLGGLVVNSAIFVFTDYRQHTSGSQSRRVAKAIYQKAWPITLTVISTCVGLIPFLINGDAEVFWFALAIGMIGGLSFSTLVVFFVLPVLMIERGSGHSFKRSK